MKLPVALTFVHKWIGIIIGIQIVLWVAGGLVMSAFPIELVRGESASAPADKPARLHRRRRPPCCAAIPGVRVRRCRVDSRTPSPG